MAWADQSTELYFEHGITEQAGGTRRRRTWRVAGEVPDVVRALGGRPQRGDIENFPGIGDLIIDSVDFRPDSAGTIVQAVYVPPEYGTLDPPENDTGLDFVESDSTFEDVDVELPVFQVRVSQLFAAGGVPAVLTTYQAVEQKAAFRYSRTVHRITLNAMIQSGTSADTQLALTQIINEQTNKIHQINGRKYLFKPDGVRRLAVDKYQFTYRWIDDPGIPNTFNFDGQINANLGRIGTYVYAVADNDFVIPPYQRLDIAPADENDPTQPPVVVVSPNYDEDLNGWLSLPGVV